MQLSMRDWRLPALVGVAFVFARMSGGRLPFFLFYLGVGLLVGAWAWTRLALKRTSAMVSVDRDRAQVGDMLKVRVRLDNDTMLPLPWVELDDTTPPHLVATDLPRQATSVPLLGSRVLGLNLKTVRRGHYRIGPIRTTMGDPLGIFQATRDWVSKSTVTVYPRVHPIEGLFIPLSQPFGPVRTRQRAFEDPSNQAEIRNYRPGDNPRHIHWKTSARKGELMLREYELNASTQMILIPDLHAEVQAAHGQHSTAETAIEVAASLAALAVRRKIDIGMICHAQDRFTVVPGHGQRTFHETLEVLARVEPVGRLPLERVLERESAFLTNRSTLIIITPQLTGHLADMLSRLRARHQVVLIVLKRESYVPREEQGDRFDKTDLGLATMLSLRQIPVYAVAATDDLRGLGDLRLATSTEGVKGWSQPALAYGTKH